MNGIDEMPWDLSQSGRKKQVTIFFIYYIFDCSINTYKKILTKTKFSEFWTTRNELFIIAD